MKELSIEEKAKRYDEALQRAKHALDCDKNGLVNTDKPLIMSMFPELKESEDEMIRKWLIGYFHQYKEDGMEKYANGLKVESVIAWLEKQGEQKPLIEMKSPEESLGISAKEYNEIVNDSLYGESKSADKVEPKFKVGDWVIRIDKKFKRNIYLIKEIKDYYICEHFTRSNVEFSFDYIHKNFKLWDISDAKDGDVLVCDGKHGQEWKEQIFIFKGINNRSYVKNCIEYYCRVCDGEFCINKTGYMGTTSEPLYPATKEQRDLLFQKMKNAGYEWDDENKKLNMIEPKFHEGDWVVDKNGHISKIMSVDNNFNHITYACRPIEENSRDWSSYSENDIRLWDISDAKDGDVLVASDNSIFIFSHCRDNACVHHIAMEVEDGTIIVNINNKLERCWETIRGVYPATKEQRDLLFQKMKEGGYEFDFKKKELKNMNK